MSDIGVVVFDMHLKADEDEFVPNEGFATIQFHTTENKLLSKSFSGYF